MAVGEDTNPLPGEYISLNDDPVSSFQYSNCDFVANSTMWHETLLTNTQVPEPFSETNANNDHLSEEKRFTCMYTATNAKAEKDDFSVSMFIPVHVNDPLKHEEPCCTKGTCAIAFEVNNCTSKENDSVELKTEWITTSSCEMPHDELKLTYSYKFRNATCTPENEENDTSQSCEITSVGAIDIHSEEDACDEEFCTGDLPESKCVKDHEQSFLSGIYDLDIHVHKVICMTWSTIRHWSIWTNLVLVNVVVLVGWTLWGDFCVEHIKLKSENFLGQKFEQQKGFQVTDVDKYSQFYVRFESAGCWLSNQQKSEGVSVKVSAQDCKNGRKKKIFFLPVFMCLYLAFALIVYAELTWGNNKIHKHFMKTYQDECQFVEKEKHTDFVKPFKRKWYLNWFPDSIHVRNFSTDITVYPATGALGKYFKDKFDGLSLSEKQEMRYEWCRLQSFSTWPRSSSQYPSLLAKAGFFYTREGEKVECYSCGVVAHTWSDNSSPFDKHKALSPNCKFLLGEEENFAIPTSGATSGGDSLAAASSRAPSRGVDAHDSVVSATVTPAQVPSEPRQTPESDEEHRYNTFRNWPASTESIAGCRRWATAGFYYQGTEFRMACAFCHIVINEPDVMNQDPVRVHRRLNPNCPFLRSMAANSSTSSTGTRTLVHPEDFGSLGIMSDSPKHPQFSTLQSRLNTYQNWNPASVVTPQELAMAGFIHAGIGDCVKCFQCDGGLKNWLAGDQPWVEHARWFKTCSFVRLCKGQDFIATVDQKFPRNRRNTASSRGSSSSASGASASASRPDHSLGRFMESPAARSILEMGYSRDQLKGAVEKLTRATASNTSGSSGLSAENVLEVIFEMQASGEAAHLGEAREQTETSAPQPKASTQINEAAASKTLETKEAVNSTDGPQGLDTKALLERNRELIEQSLCKICLENKMCITFLPCGHLVTCPECAPALRKCPICRSNIKGRVRVYMA